MFDVAWYRSAGKLPDCRSGSVPGATASRRPDPSRSDEIGISIWLSANSVASRIMITAASPSPDRDSRCGVDALDHLTTGTAQFRREAVNRNPDGAIRHRDTSDLVHHAKVELDLDSDIVVDGRGPLSAIGDNAPSDNLTCSRSPIAPELRPNSPSTTCLPR